MFALMECPDCGAQSTVEVVDEFSTADGDVEVLRFECIAGCSGQFTALIELHDQPVALAS